MKKLTVLTGLLLAFIFTTQSYAQSHVEGPDAGTTEGTAQVIKRGVTQVIGVVGPGTGDWDEPNPIDVDVFCFTIDQPVVAASIQVFADNFDSNLLLLREGFFGIEGDDDDGVGGR